MIVEYFLFTDFTFQLMGFIFNAYYEQSSTNSRKKTPTIQGNTLILPYHSPSSMPRKNLLEIATLMGEISTFL
jgi:hypothetical protein